MRITSLVVIASLLLLTACGGSSTPTYHGEEASTEGMPGVISGRKIHPTVKLGKPYTVRGRTYVPRYQPDYTEEGLASWYGPGFHGGQTANGEQFSTNQYTAAHTTLPMPSIVKVTHVGNGKSVYVRINDRGPFAHGRIIDLSKAAAQDIGLIRDGVAKVRVEYMPAESEKFAEMLSQGREPQSIDIASEVIGKTASNTQYANITPPDESIQVADTMNADQPAAAHDKWWNPISSAHAEPISVQTTTTPPETMIVQPQPVAITTEPPASLPPSQSVVTTTVPVAQPVDPMEYALPVPTSTAAPPVPVTAQAPPVNAPPIAPEPAVISPPVMVVQPPSPTAPQGVASQARYVQVGAFSKQENAVKLQQRVSDIATTVIVPANVGGITVYRVRMGPFVNEDAALEMLDRAHSMGLNDAKMVTDYN